MAEIATIARPYAEALFKAGGGVTEVEQLNALAAVAADAELRQFADNPKVPTLQVYEVLEKVSGVLLKGRIDNFVHAVLDNGRLAALPEIAAQFEALVNAKSGVSDAVIESAYPIDASALNDVVAALEKRFKRKLKATVAVKPELIGGIRVVVGDEVLDTSVRARLEQMKTALTA